jgi:hypothetical protein
VIYRSGDHEIHSGYGSWVGRFSNAIDFAPAESQMLVLAYEHGPIPGLVFGVTNPRSNEPPRRFRAFKNALENAQPNNTVGLQERELDIEITLYDEDLVLAVFTLKYDRNGDGTYRISRVDS